MKDIHSHILYDIDDGSESLEESLSIIKQAIENNYTDIILTPHYRKNQGYVANNKTKLDLFNKLLKKVKQEKLHVNLYLGNEVTVDEDLFYYIETNQILTLNNSSYILLELPFVGRLNNLDDLLEELLEREYIPIIPHPERYLDYNEKDFIKWSKLGILFQGNTESLYGIYGNKAKKKLESMLKKHLISFMGSDIHKSEHHTYKRNVKETLMNILNDSKMTIELIDKNIEKVINNKIIKPYEVKEEKKLKLFNR